MLSFFEELITEKAVKKGIEVLTDMKNFFESSSEFVSISVEKMWK